MNHDGSFSFLSPGWLWLLPVVALCLPAYVVLQRRRRHLAVRFPNLGLLASLAPRHPGWRRHVAAAALALSTVALVLGLARPAQSEEVPRKEAIVMLAIDISGSMTATDVAPNRLAAAADAARRFVAGAPAAYRIGLVVFDDAGHVLATPTTDRTPVLNALDGLERGPGTAAGEGLYAALDAIEGAAGTESLQAGAEAGDGPFASVVMLADGADTVGRSVEEASRAAVALGVTVHTIAFGTDAGTAVVNGETVPVPVDPETMRTVAEFTGGSFSQAGTAEELGHIYDQIGTRIGTVTEQHELVAAFAGIGAATLAVAIGAAMLWTARLL